MKTNICVVLAISVLAGCKPAAGPDDDPNIPESRTAITGAFGFELGGKLPAACLAETDASAAGMEYYMATTNYPPFHSVCCLTLLDRRIYFIAVNYEGTNWTEDSLPVQAALEKKYGAGTAREIPMGGVRLHGGMDIGSLLWIHTRITTVFLTAILIWAGNVMR